MKNKKTKKTDPESKKSLLLEVGLCVVLVLAILFLSWGSKDGTMQPIELDPDPPSRELPPQMREPRVREPMVRERPSPSRMPRASVPVSSEPDTDVIRIVTDDGETTHVINIDDL